MASRGKFLAIEGIDGAGKRTQAELLARALDRRGIAHSRISFPRYDSFFGHAVSRYLQGGFGRLDRVDPHFSALLYAGDRLEAKGEIEAALVSGHLLIADRYVASNLAHQGSRVDPQHRAEFLDWVRQLEYEVFGLPAEDWILYLRVPVTESARRTAERGTRPSGDIHETNARHLEEAAAVYETLARGPGWTTIEGFDLASGQARSPENIHSEIISALDARLGLGWG